MTTGFGRRLRTVAAAALLALVAVPAAPAGTAAAADGRCASGTGVTVVVDYGPLGGGVVIGCDPDGAGKPASQVVVDAGFSLDYVSSQPGFVCRVNGRPSAEEGEDCGDTPPANAYWGLFWSDGDPATWVYSSEGAGSLDVPEGGSIGWRFQDGGARENPSAVPTEAKQTPSPQPSNPPSPQPSKTPKSSQPTPSPTPSASTPSTGGGSGPSAGSGSATPGGQAPGGQGDQAPGRDGAGAEKDESGKGDKDTRVKGKEDRKRPGAKGPKGERGLTEDRDESPVDVAFKPATEEPLTDGESSTALTLVAGAAVLVLAGSAGVIAWRRRG